jgi:phosphoglycerate dehydrogenase-like enzyme
LKVVIGQLSGQASADLPGVLRAEFPDVTFEVATTPAEQVRAIVDADVFYGQPTREAFLAARRLRWIHEPGTGIDKYRAVPELAGSGVVLTNARGPHVVPMADHVFALLLALTHRVPDLVEDKRARRWDGRRYSGRYVDLDGRTMGILALGDIGLAVARRAVGFGMKVRAVEVAPMTAPSGVESVWGPEGLDELLSLSDVLVVTAPLTEQTRGLVDRRRLALLPRGAYLIVVSRGGIVDEAALAEALRSGGIAGAGLDVTSQEPLPPESPLWELENVLISPHSSASSPVVWPGRRRIFEENLRRFLAGEPFLYVCDKKAGY